MPNMLDLFNYAPVIEQAAQQNNIPTQRLQSLINVESGGNANATSPKGARGFFQVMPETAANPGFGVAPFDPNDPVQNIRGGAAYYAALARHNGGDWSKADAAYNAGPGRVDRGGPLPAETQAYVPKVEAGANENDMLALFNRAGAQPTEAPQLTNVKPAENEWDKYMAKPAGERFISNAWDQVNPLGIVKAIAHPIDTVEGLYEAHKAEFEKAKAAYEQGHYLEAAGHGAAAAIPVVGPNAAHAGEQIAQGDIAGGLGSAVGLVTALEAPRVAKGIANKIKVVPNRLMETGHGINQALRNENPGVNFGDTYRRFGIENTARGMAKGVRVSDALKAEVETIPQKYPGGTTDFPPKVDAYLAQEVAARAKGAAPEANVAAVQGLRNELNRNPQFTREAPIGRRFVDTETQVPTAAQDAQGRPIMQTVHQQVPQDIMGRKLNPTATAEATWPAMAEEQLNTRGTYGVNTHAEQSELAARRGIRDTASQSLKDLYDPQVLAERAQETPFDKIKQFFGGERQRTLSEIQRDRSDITAANHALKAKEAARENAKPFSLTTQIMGGTGLMAHGLTGGAAGAALGYFMSKPGGLTKLARLTNIPVEVLQKAAQGGPATSSALIAGNTTDPRRTLTSSEVREAYAQYLAASHQGADTAER